MLRGKTVAVLLALALIAAACATGGTPQAEGPSAVALTPTSVTSSVATSQTGGDANSEGIKVHGHWTIEVRGLDGSIEDRIEFDNALTPNGQAHLILLLTGECTATDWGIKLNGDFLPGGSDARSPGSITISSVDVSRESDGSGLFLRLAGSANREDAFFIGSVETQLAVDDAGPASSVCGIRDFTRAPIEEFEIPANKTVDVVVEFRFS